MEIVGVIGFWLLWLVAGAIITILLNDPIYFVLARLFGGRFRKNRVLNGNWATNYKYQTTGGWKEDNPSLRVHTFGKYFVANGSSTIDGSTYKLKGKLTEEGIVTGDWQETTCDNRQYYGVFQLLFHTTNTELEGYWLGHGRKGGIKSGKWNWKRSNA